MAEVKIIKATQTPVLSQTARSGEDPVRVAAYCRVSTDSEEQENSYEAQQAHYRRMIASRPEWSLAGIFADEGITGTSAKKRPQFLEMIKRCEAGGIDLVLTKSISRFARNTLDCLNYVRKLKALNIPVIFEKEGVNTMDSSGELLLTILASISQQESASISENVRLGHVYNFQQGKGMLNPKYFMGYDRGERPHEMVINPEQSVIVRRIYRSFLEGFSPAMIAKDLNRESIPTATGTGRWFDTTITSILKNEKHCGDLLMQKYFTEDFLTHKVVKNKGQRQQYFLENDHDPIIPREIFLQVQGELRRRSFLKADPNKVRFGSSSPLNGRTFCGKCGRKLKRLKRKGDGTIWICEGHVPADAGDDSRCILTPVKESLIIGVVLDAFNHLRNRYGELVRLEEHIRSAEILRIDTLLGTLNEEQERLEAARNMPAATKKSSAVGMSHVTDSADVIASRTVVSKSTGAAVMGTAGAIKGNTDDGRGITADGRGSASDGRSSIADSKGITADGRDFTADSKGFAVTGKVTTASGKESTHIRSISDTGDNATSMDTIADSIDFRNSMDWTAARLEEIRRKKNTLFYERAEAANRDVQVRILLELAQMMYDAACGKIDTETVIDDGGPCRDPDDFFRKTQYRVPEGILDGVGHITAFANGLVIRYLKRVDISEDEIVVQFKAGIEEHIKRASATSLKR